MHANFTALHASTPHEMYLLNFDNKMLTYEFDVEKCV